jgi:DNA-binding transcriptional LysR family regulator
MISRAKGPIVFDQAMEICQARNCTPKIINYYTHAASTLISVNVGVGMTILPMSLVSDSKAENIVVFPIDGNDTVLSHSVAWHKQSSNRASDRFKEIVLELFE